MSRKEEETWETPDKARPLLRTVFNKPLPNSSSETVVTERESLVLGPQLGGWDAFGERSDTTRLTDIKCYGFDFSISDVIDSTSSTSYDQAEQIATLCCFVRDALQISDLRMDVEKCKEVLSLLHWLSIVSSQPVSSQ